MELKPYQSGVLRDLDRYLQYVQEHKRYDTAYNQFWQEAVGDYDPLNGTGMRPYQNNVPGVPHVCVKVPTAGGKTFIAVNALRTVFDAFDSDRPRAVVWLVPWSNLLDQTVKNLADPAHPYRQKLNSLFNHRVAIYQKKDLLQGANFNPAVVQSQLSIFVLSFGSLRAAKKEDRKIYEENGALAAFASQYTTDDHRLADTDETALINVIRSLTPVVVVDESHNAESDLSVEMLRNLNPSFILDLTATPKKNANIISFVPAIALKNEHMVKLPVIAYNHHEKSQVVESALNLQRQLETLAEAERKAGGRYIRPIVLFQAQPRTGEVGPSHGNTTFLKLKEQLLKLRIPAEQIKIKTADLNELNGIDLMSPTCPVRYIITVNALKEGWDCPFAYILASLADRSSAVDIEQILGRVLRQPYVMRHTNDLLNVSYVLTASAKFNETLQSIIRGLESAGFSRNDYRSMDSQAIDPKQTSAQTPARALSGFLFPEESGLTKSADAIEPANIQFDAEAASVPQMPPTVAAITQMAAEKNRAFEQEIQEQAKAEPNPIVQELGDKVKKVYLNDAYADIVQNLRLPQFYLEVPGSGLFGPGEKVLLNQEALLSGFRLADEDIKIDWNAVDGELYSIDLERTQGNQYRPVYLPVDKIQVRHAITEYILAKPKQGQIKDVVHRLFQLIGDMYPIPDAQIKLYLERVAGSLDAEQLRDLLNREYSYRDKIKKKIKALADKHAEQQFKKMLDVGKITVEQGFTFRQTIVPGQLGKSLGKSLYEREGSINQFEERVIMELAALPNVLFWHRNLGRGKGFAINGFKSNHYPDFILHTHNGTVILLETKGDDRDNSDSAAKNRLGQKWAQEAGKQYRYFMVFETQRLDDTYTVSELKELVGLL